MACLGPYEMLKNFLTLCFIVTKVCVLECLIIWMHTNNFYLFLQYPKCFFPPSEILCCVFQFYWLSDEGIKHWFNIYFN